MTDKAQVKEAVEDYKKGLGSVEGDRALIALATDYLSGRLVEVASEEEIAKEAKRIVDNFADLMLPDSERLNELENMIYISLLMMYHKPSNIGVYKKALAGKIGQREREPTIEMKVVKDPNTYVYSFETGWRIKPEKGQVEE